MISAFLLWLSHVLYFSAKIYLTYPKKKKKQTLLFKIQVLLQLFLYVSSKSWWPNPELGREEVLPRFYSIGVEFIIPSQVSGKAVIKFEEISNYCSPSWTSESCLHFGWGYWSTFLTILDKLSASIMFMLGIHTVLFLVKGKDRTSKSVSILTSLDFSCKEKRGSVHVLILLWFHMEPFLFPRNRLQGCSFCLGPLFINCIPLVSSLNMGHVKFHFFLLLLASPERQYIFLLHMLLCAQIWIRPVVLIQSDFSPKGMLAMPGSVFDRHDWGGGSAI